ncbi:MAG: alginate export family protein [Verrucomicrobiia bacterium]
MVFFGNYGLYSQTGLPQEKTALSTSGTTASSRGILNDWLSSRSEAMNKIDVGGQFRLRYEVKNRAGSFPSRDFIATGVDNVNAFLVLREKLHIGYKPDEWIKFYVEGRDSSSSGDDRQTNPETDHFDLHQAFLEVGNKSVFPISLKIGRQEMIYGDERQIGALDWGNTGRVFDAAKARYETEKLWIDAFVGRVVLPDDGEFNEPNDYDWLWGIYGSSKKLLPWQETDVYFLVRNVGKDSPNAIAPGIGGPAARDIYTLGMRVKSLPGKLGGWNYAVEIAGQVGSVNSAGLRRNHEGLLADVSTHYTWRKIWGEPFLGIGYTYASGDKNPDDDVDKTYDILFPTNHKFYGLMDLWGPRNINSVRLFGGIKPRSNLSLSTDYHLVWLADDRDFFIRSPEPVGQEMDTDAIPSTANLSVLN